MARPTTKKRDHSSTSGNSDDDRKPPVNRIKSTTIDKKGKRVEKKAPSNAKRAKIATKPKRARRKESSLSGSEEGDPSEDEVRARKSSSSATMIVGVKDAPQGLLDTVRLWSKWETKAAGRAIRTWVNHNNAERANEKSAIKSKGVEAIKLWYLRLGERPVIGAYPELAVPEAGRSGWFVPGKSDRQYASARSFETTGKSLEPGYTVTNTAGPIISQGGRQAVGTSGNQGE
ncbi:uncharacterized protein LOC62_06G008410 [Vanrija pseudolonga]|uniref:Uncharacterized protein n=1 Tax=Vanrija pseudolonga TaxID=143232 RepID=A0AAF1BQJ4_9TREE|nr:hypothetical protein LOC62_06G008410 [Vanrija pseudolonga]